jgi:pimeloyl-ACP methyl ester carboxylesterase
VSASASATSFSRPGSPNLGDARRLIGEMMSTRAHADWPEPPPGDGRPVLLVPGFLAGDQSLARMARWLRGGGWITTRSGIRMNVDCMEPTIQALERHLEKAVDAAGGRAMLVGQSRGGTFGRVLAVRRPDLVESLVTLGSPVLNQMALSRSTQAAVTLVGLLGTIGIPRMFSHNCRNGACCELARAQLTEPLSDEVRYIAFYSRQDPIVSWEACCDPQAELVEVDGTHSGMSVSRAVWTRMSELLAAA